MKDCMDISRLKLYSETGLDPREIMSLVQTFETGIVMERLMIQEKYWDGLHVHVCWTGLPDEGDTLDPIGRVNKDIPHFLRFLTTKELPSPSRYQPVAS